MNDKALYQLERAIDALTEMAKYLREDKQNIQHSEYWFDYNRNDRNRANPFEWHSGGITFQSSSSPDVITF